jgi:hypothetical protein
MDNIKILQNLGFEDVGEWKLEGSTLSCEINRYANEYNILYAFVSQDEIKYIGKSVRALKNRMYGYKFPGPTQRTNLKNNQNIIALLQKDIQVKIMVFIQKNTMEYGGFEVNLAAGLEDSLISQIKPEWNNSGRGG